MDQADSGADEGAEKSTFQFGTWYPIETAPRVDGQSIILCRDPFEPVTGAWRTDEDRVRGKWFAADPADFESDEDWFMFYANNNYEPTHWMPLPPPPSNVDRSDGPKSDAGE